MSQTAGVGSIVNRAGKRLMIVGYNLVEEDGHVGLAYLGVPCPLGFVTPESFVLLDASDVAEIEQNGYVSPDVDAFCSSLDDVRLQGLSVPFDEYVATMQSLANDAARQGEAEE